MKILLVHNFYLEPGGEDQVFAAESEVLRAHGDDVRTYTVHNSRIASMGRLHLAAATVWNREVLDELTNRIGQDRPDLVHFHNTFPLISPAGYAAARHWGIPVVQTLHNFRLLCVNALFLRDGKPCEDCLGHAVAWPGVVHACYRRSRRASAVVAGMLAVHRVRRTWDAAVDTYIAMSEFARDKFVAGGLPPQRIVVKSNFLAHDPGVGTHEGNFALYVGRLSPEKGIEGLLDVWRRLAPPMRLRIIGSGPLESSLDRPPGVEFLGRQPRECVLAAMKDARVLVFPSVCYENFPLAILEAMATGLPVIASHQGSVPEIVEDGRSGVLVPSGNPEHWAGALGWAMGHPEAMGTMGHEARRLFEDRYTPDAGYRRLSDVYRGTISRSRSQRAAAAT